MPIIIKVVTQPVPMLNAGFPYVTCPKFANGQFPALPGNELRWSLRHGASCARGDGVHGGAWRASLRPMCESLEG